MRKLTPCCRDEAIFAQTHFASIFSGYFPARVFLRKKGENEFLDENCFSTSSNLKSASLIS